MLLYIGIDTLDVQLESAGPDLSRNTLTDESAPGSRSRPGTFSVFTPPNSLTRLVSLSSDPLPLSLLAISVLLDQQMALIFFSFFFFLTQRWANTHGCGTRHWIPRRLTARDAGGSLCFISIAEREIKLLTVIARNAVHFLKEASAEQNPLREKLDVRGR